MELDEAIRELKQLQQIRSYTAGRIENLMKTPGLTWQHLAEVGHAIKACSEALDCSLREAHSTVRQYSGR